MDAHTTREHAESSGNAARKSACETQERLDEHNNHARQITTDGGEIDPFTDEHNIEYWLWDGAALIPASPVESERLRKREAMLRLTYWQESSGGNDRARPTRWHTIITAVQTAIGKLHAHLYSKNAR